jgi:hypothetical protein
LAQRSPSVLRSDGKIGRHNDGYCYLPLYIFCGPHLLASKLRRVNIDAPAGRSSYFPAQK